jgi:uncharacterized delta-60 repeat protein
MNRVFLAAMMAVFLVSGAHAAPGDLDTTFGGGKGWVHTPPALYPGDNVAKSVIEQADGKLVAAGTRSNGLNKDDFALVRYNSDGSLDTTFDGDGRLTTTFSTSNDRANAVIQQADGKLVAVGSGLYGARDDFALARYNSDGSLDTSFDGDGMLNTDISGWDDQAYSVIQQSDGKLVVAGNSNNGSINHFALVRYNSNGSLDTSFNLTGRVTTGFGGSWMDRAVVESVIQQADGKLVAVGWYEKDSSSKFALARYNSDGSLDTSFDGDGKLITNIGDAIFDDRLYSVTQQMDGKLVAAGFSSGANGDTASNFVLVRYNVDGSLDTSFDRDGKLTTDIGVYDSARFVTQQADGKLLATGISDDGIVLARYNSDGSLDVTFNGTGISDAVGGMQYIYSSVQQADGKLVAAGSIFNTDGDVFNNDFALVRCNADGSLDTTFNGTGKVTTDIGASKATAYSMIRQPDGKLVVAGNSASASNGSENDFALLRYNVDGTLDSSFDVDGKLTTDVGLYDVAHSVIQQFDGKLVVAGNGMVRYNSDGSLDTTFNGTGSVTVSGAVGAAYSLIQQTDGKLVVAGSKRNGNNDDFALARYNSDGSLDATFDGDGMLTTDFSGSNDQAYSMIQQADGRLVVAGHGSPLVGGQGLALVRYNLDGSLDGTFDSDGKAFTVVNTLYGGVKSVIQQVDGKLVVAVGSSVSFVLVRYNSDGSLDTTFDEDGTLSTYMNGHAFANSVIQQSDGKLVVAGSSPKAFNDDFALVRYNSDGSLDTTFGDGGRQVTTISVFDDEACSVIQQPDGKLVVAGYSDGMPTGREFILVRYESGLIDTDNDGYWDGLDNCASVANPAQSNTDGDAMGDVCDAFPLDPTESVDADNDGTGNNADTDDDNDTLPDVWEQANGKDPFKADYMVSVGGFHGCALDNNGVSCWGTNNRGQTTVPALAVPTMVSAGYRHTCAIDSTGVKCWGAGVTDTGSGDDFGQSIPPVLTNPTAVSAGYWHTCAIDEAGVQCWGKNEYGQTTVPSGLVDPVTISAGKHHTCVLDKNGVHCWGANYIRQSSVPALVNPRSVVAGDTHGCAVDQSGVVCWGRNSGGQSTPPALTSPQLLAVGMSHSCALDSGNVACWGRNGAGQTAVSVLSNPVSLDAGLYHTCALDSTGVVCWGRDNVGQATVPVLDITHP